MTRHVVSVGPDSIDLNSARLMSQNNISGLPVVHANGSLLVVSERDFLRRAQIGNLAAKVSHSDSLAHNLFPCSWDSCYYI
jgi:CBS domain-containing protein